MRSKHDEKHLTRLGFKKHFPDEVEPEYFYYKLDIPSKLIENLHIIVEERINVYCDEAMQIGNGNDVCIISEIYSFENVAKIVNRFKRFHCYDNRRKK